ncbi:MAG: hypothetical protein JSV39_03580 [Candidatus Aenigmatarchaeota archaeon]|nr:MAG: hypothetical protein JSV39_03580 [Candidatus Aenigmarchaeota archaeon]
MKKLILITILSLSLVFLAAKPADAGISLGTGGVTLSAGETHEVCDIWIYALRKGDYHVETTGDLKPLTVSVTPSDFTLDETIDCPQEAGARRGCITDLCMAGDQPSCETVCVKFTAPMLIEWEPQRVEYSGSILNVISVGAAKIQEPYTFSVFVNPMDMKPLAYGAVIAIIVIVVLLILFVKMRKR